VADKWTFCVFTGPTEADIRIQIAFIDICKTQKLFSYTQPPDIIEYFSLWQNNYDK
jgi:hypothetical protein